MKTAETTLTNDEKRTHLKNMVEFMVNDFIRAMDETTAGIEDNVITKRGLPTTTWGFNFGEITNVFFQNLQNPEFNQYVASKYAYDNREDESLKTEIELFEAVYE